ncbi:MAG: tetratricopeptide repeat protein [Candidatus Competibacteraceae bacterium]|nr:tetratricopeptide repeat protein [Candidatus Competibacteraceae bacterium]
MSQSQRFEALLAQGQDNALLRYSLGNAYLNEGRPDRAHEHLQQALSFDPHYSVAWKLLGRALTELDKPQEAEAAYRQGIRVAQGKGDSQAAKEMEVFLKRLHKSAQ